MVSTTINNFSASLAGTLFNSMQQLQCCQRVMPVSKSSSQPDQQQDADQQEQSNHSKSVYLRQNIFQANEQQPQKNESPGPKDYKELSLKQQQEVTELQQRDQEVRNHEQAHLNAAGGHVNGGATYSYQTGPDGRQYATGGSVNIDVSPVPGNPEATEEKAKTVRKAALAPATPSAQDQKVASQAAAMEMQARMEQTAEAQEAQKTDDAEKTEDPYKLTPAQERLNHTAITAYRDAQSPVTQHPIFSSFM